MAAAVSALGPPRARDQPWKVRLPSAQAGPPAAAAGKMHLSAAAGAALRFGCTALTAPKGHSHTLCAGDVELNRELLQKVAIFLIWHPSWLSSHQY